MKGKSAGVRRGITGMKRLNMNCQWIISAAIGVVATSIVAPFAAAQFQTSASAGRALDANNRLGSNGVNDTRREFGGATADDTVYGNITGGRQFRGNLNSTDARAFRGNISRPSDNLVREAGPSVYQSTTADRMNPRAFYGDSRGVTAPVGFGQIQPGSPGQFEVARPTFRIPGDVRMDATIPNPDLGLSRPGVYILPGVNTDAPIAGDLTRSLPRPGLSGVSGDMLQPSQAPLSDELLKRIDLDQDRIREMRLEYERGGEGGLEPANPNDLTIAPESPLNPALNQRMTTEINTQAVSGSLETQQSLRQRLVTAAPTVARQDTQYASLRDRLNRRQRREMTDEEANREFLQEWDAQQQGEGGDAQQPIPLPTMQQREVAGDDEEATLGPDRRRLALRQQERDLKQETTEGPLPPQPQLEIKIASFADGVKTTGLKKLLKDAEDAMKAGQYTQALDYYDAAAAVAENNSMVLMGRALAELGAGYYARAQVHLERVLSADPALLLARYDLKAFYGDERLQYIVRDLKDLAQTETRQSRPLFLLGFIAYSTENEERAADYLALAEQRGGPTEFYNELREYWELDKKKDQAPQVEQAPPQPQ